MSTLWQPLTWNIFHIIALNYNEIYRDQYISFFEAFKVIIPCSICKNHYNNNLNNSNLSIENNINKDRIFNWTIDLHNSVNKMNHKKIWSYDEARNYYTNIHLTTKVLKLFIYEFIKANFKKKPEKTINLIKMLQSIAYLHPNEEKRNKLIDFKQKFELNRFIFKKWLIAFILIIEN